VKDRDGNEWRLVPVNATEEMIADMLASKDFDGIWPAAIAAAPQFVAGEVTKEMCWNVFEDCDGCEKNMAETARHWLDRWRKELGPALGLVEIREPSDDECRNIWRDAKANEGDGSKVCAGRAMFTAVSKCLKGEL